jgi:hypothetical protein
MPVGMPISLRGVVFVVAPGGRAVELEKPVCGGLPEPVGEVD